MESKTIIAKFGGNIIESEEHLKSTLNQFKSLLFEKKIVNNVIIIPGGGSFANFVRIVDKKLNIGDDLSHWMAVFAMNLNGLKINEKFKDIECVNDINQLKKNKNLLSIFLPFNFLKQTDQLPHSWEVTSDSITIYIANHLGLQECYLIKEVDGIFIKDQIKPIQEISIHQYEEFRRINKLAEIKGQFIDLKKSKPIDDYSLKLINDFKISCVILNGTSNSKRIITYFDKNQSQNNKFYTRIINNT